MAFGPVPADLQATFHHAAADRDQTPFPATLVELGGDRLATGKDFSSTGKPTPAARSGAVVLLDQAAAGAVRDARPDRPVAVRSVERKPYTRRPSPPFMTSTLRAGGRAASCACRSAQKPCPTAQRLYENGYITYMRTDSTTLSDTASAARSQILEKYGKDYLPDAPRTYADKVEQRPGGRRGHRPWP